jgi:hypothetical protein
MAKDIAWTHRKSSAFQLYFISNQRAEQRTLKLSLRSTGYVPELWDPLTGEMHTTNDWRVTAGRTVLPISLEPNGSIFIILRKKTIVVNKENGKNRPVQSPAQTLAGTWKVQFDPKYGGPKDAVTFNQLDDWSKREESDIKYYSGTAGYNQLFTWNNDTKGEIWLDLGRVENLAEVYVNGINCGVAWTWPYRVNITKALKKGTNQLKIEVSNTWANRLMGDHALPEKERTTWTNAPYRLEGKSLLPAGLLGPVKLIRLNYK